MGYPANGVAMNGILVLRRSLCSARVVNRCIGTRNAPDRHGESWMIELECLQCGKKYFVHNYRKNKSRFCSRHCRSIYEKNRVDCVCSTCGKTFERIPSQVKITKKQFCSVECIFNYGRIKLKCSFCGREYIISKSKLSEKTVNNYCSNECKFKDKKTGMQKVCPICNKEFWVMPYQIELGTGIYCSQDCYGKHLSKFSVGENHPNWRGGLSYEPYCQLFNNEFKERVREFFGRRCVECGASENGKRLSVHHVVYDKEACCNEGEAVENRLFVPLCASCHTRTNHNRDYWQEKFTNLIQEQYGGKCYFTKEEYERPRP